MDNNMMTKMFYDVDDFIKIFTNVLYNKWLVILKKLKHLLYLSVQS